MACRTARSRIRRLAFQLIFQASGSSPLDTARPVHSWLPRRRSLSRLETMRVPCGHLNYECPHNSSYYSKKHGKSLRKCGNSRILRTLTLIPIIDRIHAFGIMAELKQVSPELQNWCAPDYFAGYFAFGRKFSMTHISDLSSLML